MDLQITTQALPRITLEVSPQGVVSAFLSGRNEQTLSAYRKDLEDFKKYLQVESIEAAAVQLLSQKPPQANAMALSYRGNMLDRKLSSATINRRLSALRSLWKLAMLVGVVSAPLVVEGLRDEPYRDTRGPTREEIGQMLKLLEGSKETKDLRNWALLKLMFTLALRRGEVLSARLQDLDMRRGTLSILGKGRRSRQVMTLPLSTQEALREWLKLRGEEEGPLFLRVENNGELRQGGLSENGLYGIIQRLGEKIGLKIRPHAIRHSAITEALTATNGDVRKVQKLSRHKDLRVLCLYDDARQDFAGEVSEMLSVI
jgi:integrase/recombinase XerC